MLRSRENLHIIYVLLFLEAAFYLLQVQDVERYRSVFAFIPEAFLRGEFWRVFTYQFIHGSALGLFFALLILYIMGNALEEMWGSTDFIVFWLLSVLGSALVALVLGFPFLIGSFFLSYSLLFAYAATFPEMTFYLFFVLPVKVKWLAWIALAILGFGLFSGSASQLAAAGGAMASFAYFWVRHGKAAGNIRFPRRPARQPLAPTERPPLTAEDQDKAEANLALFQEIESTLEGGDPAASEALAQRISENIVPGVNICPPPDYKPKAEDRYCIQCEGFAECSARFIRLNSGAGEVDSKS
ncbi:MAG: rhomboid family intramembrane serine protease [Thermoanaerobaculia bacterium]